MIRLLRKKLVLINMSLVLVVLLAVFTALCVTTANNQLQTAARGLSALLERHEEDFPQLEVGKPGDQEGESPARSNGLSAGFVLSIDSTGTVTIESLHSVSITDGTAQALAQMVQDSGKQSGLLRAYSLRYQTVTENEITRIAFLDVSGSLTAMSELIITSLLVGVLALLAFLFVSLLLANLALKPAEAAWNRQKQFIADASHELKTPLTVILANQKILLSHPKKTIAEERQWVENTQSEGERMKSLVEDLLFLAKSDGAKTSETLSDVNVSEVVQGTILSFASLAFEAGVTLNDTVQPGIVLTGSESKLRRLCGVLLDNALKYVNARGTVDVDLRVESGNALLRVRNTGVPIAEEDLSHLFERFYRVDRARSEGGYGLGLSIAESIVKLHGGKISVASTAETGTTFTVALPLRGVSPRQRRKDLE